MKWYHFIINNEILNCTIADAKERREGIVLDLILPQYEYEDVKCFAKPIDTPPFWIEMTGISNCDERYRISREDSPIAVCEYIIKGSGNLCMNQKMYHPKAGDVYILSPYTKHEYYTNPDEPWVKMFFNIYGSSVSPLIQSFGLKDKVVFSNCEELRELFEAFYKKTQEHVPVEWIMEECNIIFIRLLSRLRSRIAEKNENSMEAQAIKHFIESNIHRELTMKEISASIYRSADYTNRLFKRCYDITPYAYYINLRIERAKALLQHTSLSIQEISEKLGYKNEQYFSKQFRHVAGMTASSYRRNGQG